MTKNGMLFQKVFPIHGTIISILASNPNSAGEFYAINNRGDLLTDSGVLDIAGYPVVQRISLYFFLLSSEKRIDV